jgi:hypothetical protein
MGARENKVEKYLDEEVVLLGGLTRKWVSNVVGAPDRIVILQGEVWFVEVKTVDGRLSDVQNREHARLLKAGAKVATVYGRNGVDNFMEYFKC